MIHFHTTRRYAWTLRGYLKHRAPHLIDRIQITPYDQIDLRAPIPPGVHLFADLERLLKPEMKLAQRLHDRLAEHPESYRTINNPSEWVGRFDLLSTLADRGDNDFRVHRLDDLDHVRFPAFLRWEHDHSGSVGDPVETRAALDGVIADSMTWTQRPLKHRLMVTEKLDIRDDDGLHRKYSAMMIGDELIPRHLMFTHHWMTKFPDVVGPDQIEEELAFLNEFPHQQRIREVFTLSGLTYGRIDYGFFEGRLQVWEINTNPVVVLRRGKLAKERRPGQRRSADLVTAALEKVLASAPNQPAPRLFSRRERWAWPTLSTAIRGYDRHRR